MLRTAGLATAAVGLVCIIAGTVVKGADGFKGAVFATALVLVFFAIGQMIVGGVLRRAPEMAMTVALMTYLIKIGVLFVIIILFAHTTLFNTKVFAITVVSCTIAWVVAEVWVYSRSKVLYVEPEQRR